MEWLYSKQDPLYETLIASLLLFTVIIVLTRIGGLRSFAKFTVYDFAFTVAIGSLLSSVLTSNTSVVHGSVAIAGLLAIKLIFSFLQRKSPFLNKIISNDPLLLMDGNIILHKNLKAARIQESQLIAKLREANVLNYNQVYAVVLETTGDISVLHTSGNDKDEQFDENLLSGVIR